METYETRCMHYSSALTKEEELKLLSNMKQEGYKLWQHNKMNNTYIFEKKGKVEKQ